MAVPSRFTHDVVRADDSVFVCDTGNGRILQLSFPDMTPVSKRSSTALSQLLTICSSVVLPCGTEQRQLVFA